MDNSSELQNDISEVAVIAKDDSKKSTKPLGELRKAVLRQQLMVLLGNTGILGAGMAVALPSATLGQLTDTNEDFYLDRDQASWYSSINIMACPLGGLLVSYLLDKFGRKWTILLTNIVGIFGWLLMCTAPLYETKSAIYTQLLVGRFFSGIMIGLCLSPVGVYSAEISLPRIRGRLILYTSIGIAAGILFMYVLGYFIRHNWHLIAIISCAYQIISTLCVFPIPETPSWLMQSGKTEQARKSLKYFRGLEKNDIRYYEEFEEEYAQLKKSSENSRSVAAQEASFIKTLKAPEVYKPIIVMLGFFAFQQLSGVVVVVVLAVQIAYSAGISIDPVLVAVFVGIARITTVLLMSGIFEKWGRKPAGIISAAGMAICMFLLAACSWWSTLSQTLPYLSIIALILYIVFSTMGLLTLPFFMISEVFPQRVRGGASGLTVCFGLTFSFAVIKFFPDMESSLGMPAVFAFFGGVSFIAVFYIFYFIPETRGRTLLEIEEYFRTGKKFNDANIQRRQPFIQVKNYPEMCK